MTPGPLVSARHCDWHSELMMIQITVPAIVNKTSEEFWNPTMLHAVLRFHVLFCLFLKITHYRDEETERVNKEEK
jgi:hypothetical protein